MEDKAEIMALPYPLLASVGSKVFKPGEKDMLTDAIKEVDELMYRKKAEYHKIHG